MVFRRFCMRANVVKMHFFFVNSSFCELWKLFFLFCVKIHNFRVKKRNFRKHLCFVKKGFQHFLHKKNLSLDTHNTFYNFKDHIVLQSPETFMKKWWGKVWKCDTNLWSFVETTQPKYQTAPLFAIALEQTVEQNEREKFCAVELKPWPCTNNKHTEWIFFG